MSLGNTDLHNFKDFSCTQLVQQQQQQQQQQQTSKIRPKALSSGLLVRKSIDESIECIDNGLLENGLRRHLVSWEIISEVIEIASGLHWVAYKHGLAA